MAVYFAEGCTLLVVLSFTHSTQSWDIRQSRAIFLRRTSYVFFAADGWKTKRMSLDDHARSVNGYRIIQPEVHSWRLDSMASLITLTYNCTNLFFSASNLLVCPFFVELGERMQIVIDWDAIRCKIPCFGLSLVVQSVIFHGLFPSIHGPARLNVKKKRNWSCRVDLRNSSAASRVRPRSPRQMKICHCQSVAVEIRTRWRSHQHAKTLLFVWTR